MVSISKQIEGRDTARIPMNKVDDSRLIKTHFPEEHSSLQQSRALKESYYIIR